MTQRDASSPVASDAAAEPVAAVTDAFASEHDSVPPPSTRRAKATAGNTTEPRGHRRPGSGTCQADADAVALRKVLLLGLSGKP